MTRKNESGIDEMSVRFQKAKTDIKPPTVLHFRVVYPEGLEGRKHSAWTGKVYVSFPGKEEVELPGVKDISADWGVHGMPTITVDVFGTIVVQYGETDA